MFDGLFVRDIVFLVIRFVSWILNVVLVVVVVVFKLLLVIFGEINVLIK